MSTFWGTENEIGCPAIFRGEDTSQHIKTAYLELQESSEGWGAQVYGYVKEGAR